MLAFLNPFVIRLHESNKYPRLPDTIKTRRHGITSLETSQENVAFVVVVVVEKPCIAAREFVLV